MGSKLIPVTNYSVTWPYLLLFWYRYTRYRSFRESAKKQQLSFCHH